MLDGGDGWGDSQMIESVCLLTMVFHHCDKRQRYNMDCMRESNHLLAEGRWFTVGAQTSSII